MKRIDDDAVVRIVSVEILERAHQEVAGKIDPFSADAGPSRDFDVDEAQRDRDARAPIHDVVQTAVARVLVLLAIALEGQLAKQIPVQRIDARLERRVVAGILRDAP